MLLHKGDNSSYILRAHQEEVGGPLGQRTQQAERCPCLKRLREELSVDQVVGDSGGRRTQRVSDSGRLTVSLGRLAFIRLWRHLHQETSSASEGRGGSCDRIGLPPTKPHSSQTVPEAQPALSGHRGLLLQFPQPGTLFPQLTGWLLLILEEEAQTPLPLRGLHSLSP